MPLLSTVYCTLVELDRFLSAQAVIDFGDHDADGVVDVDVVEDCINQATEQIDMYLHQVHTQTQLSTSTLITRWCVVMSARYLCQRRGNIVPNSIQVEWDEEIKPMLIETRQTKQALFNVPLRDDMRPTWSNLKVDRRWRHSKVRVTPNSSDAPTKLTQDRVVESPRPWD